MRAFNLVLRLEATAENGRYLKYPQEVRINYGSELVRGLALPSESKVCNVVARYVAKHAILSPPVSNVGIRSWIPEAAAPFL